VPDILSILSLCALAAFLGAAAGAWFTGLPDVSRRMIPFSGAVLVAIALFWILPELAATFSWTAGLVLMLGGVGVIAAIDRFVYPVCPACSHTHDHDHCSSRLHGFASPLIIAALLHSLFDGWAFATGYASTGSRALSYGVAIHKIPEGIALGVILRAALRGRGQALAWAAAIQLMTILGGVLQITAAPWLGPQWIAALLALGGGMFLYLGGHAMHGEWKRRSSHRHAEAG
jgi:zinc and cadmium transporter